MIRLKLHGPANAYDETVVYFQAGATDGFDPNYDSYFLAGPNSAPHISQNYNSTLMTINGIAPVSTTFSINIQVTTPATGNFTITADDFAELPAGTCAFLEDLQTGISMYIMGGGYSFQLSSTTAAPRFVLTIIRLQLPFALALTQPNCQQNSSGRVKISPQGAGPWNYTWKDSTGSVIKTTSNAPGSDSLNALAGGNYKVEIASASGCSSSYTTFTIDSVILPDAHFQASDSVVIGLQSFKPSNKSVQCVAYTWNFGDGRSNAAFEPTHNYTMPGLYKVKLTGTSSSGCSDSTSRYVTVKSITTHLSEELARSVKIADLGGNRYRLISGSEITGTSVISVMALDGKVILQQEYSSMTDTEPVLDLGNFATGVYVINLNHENTMMLSRKVIVR